MFRKKSYRKIVILIAGIAIIAGMFVLPPYKKWWFDRPVTYWKDFLKQKKQLGLEHRKKERFNAYYKYSWQIAAPFAKRPDKKKILILMPPTRYFEKKGIPYVVYEPGIFYYLTDIRTVWVNSLNAEKANWYIKVVNKRIFVDSVIDKKSLCDTIASYKKFF
jgi:hypothetical protein